MPGLTRTSVSLETELLERIDQLCAEGRFASRSDAFRRVFQEILTASAWRSAQSTTATASPPPGSPRQWRSLPR